MGFVWDQKSDFMSNNVFDFPKVDLELPELDVRPRAAVSAKECREPPRTTCGLSRLVLHAPRAVSVPSMWSSSGLRATRVRLTKSS